MASTADYNDALLAMIKQGELSDLFRDKYHGYPEFAAIKSEFDLLKQGELSDLFGVLTACCHAGKVDFAREMFYSMKSEYGMEPKAEHYGCMVNLLGRSGRLKEAKKLVRGMKCEVDVMVLGALLSSCRSHGDIEIAERVARMMLRADPSNHGVYVVLSNMYAELGDVGGCGEVEDVYEAWWVEENIRLELF